jgi:hypothetical protein
MSEHLGKNLGTKSEAPAEETAKYVKIPAKYADAAKSPLRVTLKNGDQKYDIELQD